MDLQRKPLRKNGFHVEQLDDAYLLYHPGGDQIVQMNPTAYVIWQLCDGQRTVDELVEVLQQAYPDAVNEIATDVPEMLQQWAKDGCVDLL